MVCDTTRNTVQQRIATPQRPGTRGGKRTEHQRGTPPPIPVSKHLSRDNIKDFFGRVTKASFQVLWLQSNAFSGSIPDWFCSSLGLSTFTMTDNRLTGSLPEAIASMSDNSIFALGKSLSAPKSRDFYDCDCEFPPHARNRCDFPHRLNKETLRFKGANFHRQQLRWEFCEFRAKSALFLRNSRKSAAIAICDSGALRQEQFTWHNS